MSTPHVFLSYNRESFAEAKRLRDDLQREGIAVWWDQKILPGQSWRREIRNAIKDCGAFVLCLSKEAVTKTKSGVYPEALQAVAIYREYKPGETFFIPVRFSDCEIPDLEIDATNTLQDLEYVDRIFWTGSD